MKTIVHAKSVRAIAYVPAERIWSKFFWELWLVVLCLAVSTTGSAQNDTSRFSVEVSASVQASPAQIVLSWPQDPVGTPTSYTVSRKLISDAHWGAGTVLPGTTTSFVDKNVANGSAYEYQVVKAAASYTGYGYIYAGINAPLTESRGKVILMVDDSFSSPLASQIAQLEQDLIGDGWTILRHDVSRSDSVTHIKSLIVTDYNSDPANVNTVFLLGHIPVPYSGDIAPDEHVPNHKGAWPADVYYGSLFGNWTDSSVNDNHADDSRNWNVPGDGKFDQSTIPGGIQLMVGRVDLANLPGETTWNGPATLPSEQTLLANYLAKNHKYRQKSFNLPRAGVIGDYFGDYGGEAFAASGWRNFAPFFGPQNITVLPNEGTWLNTLRSQPFLWSYACGPGNWDSIAGVGNDDADYDAITPDFYKANIQSVFTMLFGSWFGDWDVKDDLMRGALAAPGYTLACMWSGSPHWFCHHMALGQTLGYSTRLTQNNGPSGLYQTEVMTYAGLIHVALMGDPTLRMHVVAPPGNLTTSTNAGSVQLSWNGSSDSILGYNVYRAATADGPFTRLNNQLVTGNSYLDVNPPGGSQTYMVRAVKLENTPSGTYYNASQGIFSGGAITVTNSNPAPGPFFTDEDALGNDWYYLTEPGDHNFGYFNLANFPYIYHLDMGWEYYTDAHNAANGAYFYDFTDGTFVYTEPGLFPYIYDFRRNAWLYYAPLDGTTDRYPSNPRWFYDFSAQEWTSHL